MIEGHGDDSYKYHCPITTNFSSNIYGQTDLSGLRAHLCRCIQGENGSPDALTTYPEPEPFTLEARLAGYHHLPAASVCVTDGAYQP